MRRRDLLVAAGLLTGFGGARARAEQTIPDGYDLVWSDEFKAFSLRKNGLGTWACPGIWYSKDPRGVVGYSGWDWFVNPLYALWPHDYRGQVVHTAEGLRIRAEAPSSRMAALLPKVKGKTPWLCGQVNSFYAVRISPPFYFEASAKMPPGVGQPWTGIWLVGDSHHHAALGPEGTPGKEYEIDVHESFGDSDYLHSTIHWNTSPVTADYPHQGVVYTKVNDLATDFNVWGCHVTTER